MYSLLFIEDDDQIRLALSLALEDEGYKVARGGRRRRRAWRRSPSGEPDLVLLDLRLPDMSGFEVCRALRAASIVPIIIVTAQTDTYDLVAGLEAGADDYVTKPVVPKELAARIRAAAAAGAAAGDRRTARATQFGDVELRREQGIVLKAGRGAQPHQDRVPPAVRVRRPRRRRAVPRPAAGAGVGLRVPRRLAGSSTPTSAGCG